MSAIIINLLILILLRINQVPLNNFNKILFNKIKLFKWMTVNEIKIYLNIKIAHKAIMNKKVNRIKTTQMIWT